MSCLGFKFFALISLLFMSLPISAQVAANNVDRQFHYTARNNNQVAVSDATHRFAYTADGKIKLRVKWEIVSDNVTGSEESVLTKDYFTEFSHTTIEKESSEYTVRRSGNTLHLSGRFKGRSVEKTIKIDNNGFYTNPTIGLIGFAKSGRRDEHFWFLRPDNLRLVRIKAKNLGEDSIEVSGRVWRAVKIQWGPTGLGSFFFREVYWFSAEHGIFLKNVSRSGVTTEMVY